MHMHKRNKGRGSPCICSKQNRKVGVAHEVNVAIIVLPYRAFSIRGSRDPIRGQTRIIFKLGLTRMTRTKRDPDDPTRFQRWCTYDSVYTSINKDTKL